MRVIVLIALLVSSVACGQVDTGYLNMKLNLLERQLNIHEEKIRKNLVGITDNGYHLKNTGRRNVYQDDKFGSLQRLHYAKGTISILSGVICAITGMVTVARRGKATPTSNILFSVAIFNIGFGAFECSVASNLH